MYLIELINSSPRETILVILSILLVLSEYGQQCALGCLHSSNYCKHLIFMHLSFFSISQRKRKNKHSVLYFNIYIVYVSSTALCALDSKRKQNAMAWINCCQFLPCHCSQEYFCERNRKKNPKPHNLPI